MSETRQKIEPILRRTYGKTVMVTALVDHLRQRIDEKDWDSRGREHMVMCVCWDWFSGGTTAANAASKIEAALDA